MGAFPIKSLDVSDRMPPSEHPPTAFPLLFRLDSQSGCRLQKKKKKLVKRQQGPGLEAGVSPGDLPAVPLWAVQLAWLSISWRGHELVRRVML